MHYCIDYGSLMLDDDDGHELIIIMMLNAIEMLNGKQLTAIGVFTRDLECD